MKTGGPLRLPGRLPIKVRDFVNFWRQTLSVLLFWQLEGSTLSSGQRPLFRQRKWESSTVCWVSTFNGFFFEFSIISEKILAFCQLLKLFKQDL